MRVFFMGTPDFAAESLSAIHNAGFQIVGVFTQPDKPVGRKMRLESPPVKQLAEKLGIPVFQPLKLRDGTALEIIRSLEPEIITVVAYGRILPKEILDFPKYGCINIHGSLLPKYRGAAPIQWAIINGEHETGVTSMYMSEELDAGDIIDMRKVQILPGETSGSLFKRMAPVGGELLRSTLNSIVSGTAVRRPQDPELATFAPQLTKKDSPINWDEPSEKIISKIHGLDPWPSATAEINGTIFKLFDGISNDKNTSSKPGTIISAGSQGIEIACGKGSVTLTEIQAPGGKRMRASDYLRGHPICL